LGNMVLEGRKGKPLVFYFLQILFNLLKKYAYHRIHLKKKHTHTQFCILTFSSTSTGY
jgi:hypothetical protein